MPERTTRRHFLKVAGLAAAAPIFVPGTALGRGFRRAASERITLGMIGVGPTEATSEGGTRNEDGGRHLQEVTTRRTLRHDGSLPCYSIGLWKSCGRITHKPLFYAGHPVCATGSGRILLPSREGFR